MAAVQPRRMRRGKASKAGQGKGGGHTNQWRRIVGEVVARQADGLDGTCSGWQRRRSCGAGRVESRSRSRRVCLRRGRRSERNRYGV